MKWSEQMRVLLSEDEHYNQLMYDVDNNKLYINDEFIADIDMDNGTVSYNLAKEIKKKYPFFADKNFLLHCVFKHNNRGEEILEKTRHIVRDKYTIQIFSHSEYRLCIRTTEYMPS